MLKLEELLFRSWYYFRNGYGTYLSFPVSFFTFVSTTYYLAVKNLPFLQGVFAHFYVFVVVAIIFLFPFGVLIGWLHMKRTLAYPTQMAINVESNPYNYKILPGISSEISWPMWHLILHTIEKISDKENILSPEEKKEFGKLKVKIERLRKGEVIGVSKQRKLLNTSSRESI